MSRVLRTCGETRRGEIILVEFRDEGELRVYVLRAGVGVPGPDDLTETFFLIDNGSTLHGAGLPPAGALGVVSVLPVGKNGWRLLRGRGDCVVRG
jgi:hypothetical protein